MLVICSLGPSTFRNQSDATRNLFVNWDTDNSYEFTCSRLYHIDKA